MVLVLSIVRAIDLTSAVPLPGVGLPDLTFIFLVVLQSTGFPVALLLLTAARPPTGLRYLRFAWLGTLLVAVLLLVKFLAALDADAVLAAGGVAIYAGVYLLPSVAASQLTALASAGRLLGWSLLVGTILYAGLLWTSNPFWQARGLMGFFEQVLFLAALAAWGLIACEVCTRTSSGLRSTTTGDPSA